MKINIEEAKNYFSKMIGISAVEKSVAKDSIARAFYNGQEEAYRDARDTISKLDLQKETK